jgi:hypothetical protein
MLKHSARAKRNTRRQIDGIIRFLESLLKDHKSELQKMQRYKKYNLPGYSAMTTAAKQRIEKTKKDIQAQKLRRAKLSKEGKI